MIKKLEHYLKKHTRLYGAEDYGVDEETDEESAVADMLNDLAETVNRQEAEIKELRDNACMCCEDCRKDKIICKEK